MDMKLSDDNMKDIIAKAVIDTLTPAKREELIMNAVKGLLTVQAGGSYNNKSPLQLAFDSAVREVTHDIARQSIIGNVEIKAKITAMIAEAWEKLVNDENYSKIVEKVTSALERGLTEAQY